MIKMERKMATLKDTLIKIQNMKIEAEEAYERYHDEIAKLFEKHGETALSTEIEETDLGQKWLRITLTDNAKRLKSGETVVGISIVRKIGSKIDLLKNKPK